MNRCDVPVEIAGCAVEGWEMPLDILSKFKFLVSIGGNYYFGWRSRSLRPKDRVYSGIVVCNYAHSMAKIELSAAARRQVREIIRWCWLDGSQLYAMVKKFLRPVIDYRTKNGQNVQTTSTLSL